MAVTFGMARAVPGVRHQQRHDERREEREARRRRLNARRLAPRCATWRDLHRRPYLPEWRLAATHRRIGRRLRPTEIAVYGVVRRAQQLRFAGANVSNGELAELVGASERSVTRAVASLSAAGVLRSVPQFALDTWSTANGRTYERRQLANCLTIGPAGRSPTKCRKADQRVSHSRKGSAELRILYRGRQIVDPTHTPDQGVGFGRADTPPPETRGRISPLGESVTASRSDSAGRTAGSPGTPGAADRGAAIASTPVAAARSEAFGDKSSRPPEVEHAPDDGWELASGAWRAFEALRGGGDHGAA